MGPDSIVVSGIVVIEDCIVAFCSYFFLHRTKVRGFDFGCFEIVHPDNDLDRSLT